MSMLVQISWFIFRPFTFFFLFLGTLCLCLKSQSSFGLVNLILCMSIDILPRRYINTLLSSYAWLTFLRNDPLRSIPVVTCGHVTPGAGSGGGVTFESVHMWPQVQGLGVVWASPLSTNQDRVYLETSSLSFCSSMSCSPEISDIWVEGVALIYLRSFVSSCFVHKRSGALGQLCSMFCWMTDNPWRAVSEPHLKFWPRQSDPTLWWRKGSMCCRRWARSPGQSVLKRLTLPEGFHGKFKARVKEGVMEWVICSGTFSWLAGGEVSGVSIITFWF